MTTASGGAIYTATGYYSHHINPDGGAVAFIMGGGGVMGDLLEAGFETPELVLGGGIKAFGQKSVTRLEYRYYAELQQHAVLVGLSGLFGK